MERNIPSNPNIKQERYLENRNQLNFIIAHISTEEVLEIINRLLKLIPDLMLVPLCMIINQSVLTGKYPHALKISKFMPIHKNGATD